MTITAEQAAKLLEGTTPGPWRPSKSYRALVSDSPSGYDDAESVHAYGGHMVCESVQEHNRHLIAAAPDLARALIASEAARKLAEERLAAAQTIARQGRDTIATALLLEIAAALADHERVFLTRDETSLGPRVMEFAAIIKEIDNG